MGTPVTHSGCPPTCCPLPPAGRPGAQRASFQGEAGHFTSPQPSWKPWALEAPTLFQGAAVWQAEAVWPIARMQALELESVGSNPRPLTVGRIPNSSVLWLPHL